MPVTHPVHVGDHDGMPIRMFASPSWLGTRVPDMPWHSTDDLRAALGLPEGLSEEFRRRSRADWGPGTRTVATPGGLTTIAPHAMAEGLMAALRWHPLAVFPARRKAVRARYRNAATQAAKAMLGDLPEGAKLAFVLAAM